MRAFSGWIVLIGGLAWAATNLIGADSGPQASPPTAKVDFDRTVAPLLARRCLSCHNPADKKGKLDLSNRTSALAGGETGVVIVPGDLKKSLLWEKVLENEMPPKKPLGAEEKELLKNWIAGGAAWGSERIDPYRFSTESRAGYDWWSLQPVKRPEIPTAVGCDNPIDAFIDARLKTAGLAPAPAAERGVLIRRITYDLTGLPPTPDEAADFLADARPNAYERLVDRLLASPRYGERWARHWLDVARFGESNGFEYDLLRDRAWPYRDWVIEAFNADLPYRDFVRQQIAGDALFPSDARAIRATGFLVAGPFDGLVPAGEAMRQIMRQDVMEDFVGAVGQSFLGLTTHCARCHDHKFDPISQTDYYRLAAALAGVNHGERDVPSTGRSRDTDSLIAQARQSISRLEQSAKDSVLAARKANPAAKPSAPQPLARWNFADGLKDQAGTLHAQTVGGARQDAGGLQLDGESPYAASAPLKSELVEKTLEAWVRLPDLDQKGGATISVQTLDGAVFDAIVFGEREDRRWMAGSNGYVRTRSFSGPAEDAQPDKPVHFAITYQSDGTITGYRNGQPYGVAYRTTPPIRFEAGKSQVVFGLRHAPANKGKLLRGTIVKAQLYDRALSPGEVAASAGAATDYVSPEEILSALSPPQREEMDRLQKQVQLLAQERATQATNKLYAVVSAAPVATHVLIRGNPQQKGPEATPGGIAALSTVPADFGLSSTASDGERRIKLANWMTDPANPLLARVIVNRLWLYHFGQGLVASPSDFGFNGGRPSHPELLDWLASELVRRNYSLKEMQRLIVTSRTYRQASRTASSPGGPDPAAVDSDNRLLWRKSPLRLEAEEARDALLSVAGDLNLQMGGPGYYDFKTYVHKTTRYYDPIDVEGSAVQRRSVYRTWARGGRNPLLDTFDCPDPSTVTPRRAVTTTPLQALSLLNGALVLRMSDRLAERLAREAGPDPARQVERLFLLAYSRQPAASERDRLAAFVRERGLPAACRAVFNSNEFLYVE